MNRRKLWINRRGARDLPPWAADIVSNPPRSGEGFHNWLFRAARTLWKCGRSETDIRNVLERAAETCARHVTAKEVDDAVKNSCVSAFQLARNIMSSPWPDLDALRRNEIVKDGFGTVDLWEASPYRISDNKRRTEAIIDLLFPQNALLCCGADVNNFATAPREEWRGQLSGLSHIVPSPMSALTGLTQNGEESSRCLNNTGERRFLVVESDIGSADEHAAILWHLKDYAPLVMAVHSGGRSLHGWFQSTGTVETKVRRFFEYAVSLGADRALWCPCQLVRMPDGRRNDGKRQSVFYFNPKEILQ